MLKRRGKALEALSKAIDDVILKEPAMAEAIELMEREGPLPEGIEMSDEDIKRVVDIQMKRNPYRMALERSREKLDGVIQNG
jgi:hypothetical protein|tara:strand:- start:364 stop:609 length:246 start_codon:yes stop_codon:yes gene_type:complete